MRIMACTLIMAGLFAADALANQCYRRDYTAEHLARNPDQTVESLQVLFITEGAFFAEAKARFRGDAKVYETPLECWNPEGQGADVITCAVECDGGRFTTKLTDGDSILLRTGGFLVSADCGEEDLQWVRDETSGETIFKLFRTPTDRCFGKATK